MVIPAYGRIPCIREARIAAPRGSRLRGNDSALVFYWRSRLETMLAGYREAGKQKKPTTPRACCE